MLVCIFNPLRNKDIEMIKTLVITMTFLITNSIIHYYQMSKIFCTLLVRMILESIEELLSIEYSRSEILFFKLMNQRIETTTTDKHTNLIIYS